MKSNKGFTLIELLAVIVILAIIALIATPIILDVIETATRGSKESSVLGYIDAVEKQVMINQVSGGTNIIPGTYTPAALKELGVKVKGEEPDQSFGSVTIQNNGAVSAAKLKIADKYYVEYTIATQATAVPFDSQTADPITCTVSEGTISCNNGTASPASGSSSASAGA